MSMHRFTVAVLAAACALPALGGSSQSPPMPDAIVDLRTTEGVALVNGQWRASGAQIVEVDHYRPGAGADKKPTDEANRTHDIAPKAGAMNFDDSQWMNMDATALEDRLGSGRLSFNWYRITVTIPSTLGALMTTWCSVYFEIVADDYAEVWVDGRLPQVLGSAGGQMCAGWNAANRVLLTSNAQPGDQFQLAILCANGPLSDPPGNYIWIRSATLDFYKPGRSTVAASVETTITRFDPALDEIIAPSARMERLATGFTFTEGPVWVPQRFNPAGAPDNGGYLLFSDPNQNVIHRWSRADGVSIFRTKSGYTGTNIGEYFQPGSNGLALDMDGRLTICEHGNRRVTRLEKGGTLTVLAESHDGQRLNSPNDLTYRSDGALYFTDPPFGLPKIFDDPRKELPFSGVFCLIDGKLKLVSADLNAPNGLAFSPDEKHLYVDNWEQNRKVVMRYDVLPDGSLTNGVVFFDMTPGTETDEIALDGLKVDDRGNLFVSGPGGIWVLSAVGKHLGTIAGPELAANFAFGDQDGRTLYITARTGLYRLRLMRSANQTIQ
jgi:gluconolactonase